MVESLSTSVFFHAAFQKDENIKKKGKLLKILILSLYPSLHMVQNSRIFMSSTD